MPSDVKEKACKYPIEKKKHVDNLMRQIEEVYQSMVESNGLRNPISYAAPKSIEDARLHRQKGMALAKEKKLLAAYQSLNRCLMLAPPDSAELSLAYAARSSVLFSQRFYGYCLMDIEKAMKGRLPEHLKIQLRNRRTEARNRKNRPKPKSRADVESMLLERKINHRMLDNSSEPSTFDNNEWKNDYLPNTRSFVKFRYEKDASSYIVAKEDIPAGTLISGEKCYSQTLNRKTEIRLSHCAFCLLWAPCLIPCPSCTEVMYCGQLCQTNAYDAYHRTECKMIEYCVRAETDETIQQALQLLFVGTNQGLRLSWLMKTMPPYDMLIEEFKPPPDLRFTSDYLTFLNAIRNWRLWDSEARFQRTMAVPLAVNTVIALRNVSFFGDENISPKRLTKKEMFVALLLVDHIVLLKSLESEIISQVGPEDLLKKVLATGKAFFPIQTLIERSCYPNCQSYMECNHRFLFSTRPIKAGERLSFAQRNTYLIPSWMKRTDDSMAKRSNCKCEACLQKWPSLSDLKASKPVFHDKRHKDTLIFLFERMVKSLEMEMKSERELSDDVVMHPAVPFLKITSDIIEHLARCQYLQNPSYELIILETLLLTLTKAIHCNFYWPVLDYEKEFYEGIDLVTSRIESADVIRSEEDSSKCEVSEALANGNEITIVFPGLSEVHARMSGVAENKDATTTKLCQKVDDEAICNGIENCINRNAVELENIKNTTLSLYKDFQKKAEEESARIERPVKEKRLCVKSIEQILTEFKKRKLAHAITTTPEDLIIPYPKARPTTEKTSCKENIAVVLNENIDLVSAQRKTDKRGSFERANGKIEKKPTITSKKKVDVVARLNEATSSFRDRKMAKGTLDEATLLALMNEVYQVQLEFSNIFDRCYSDSKSKEVSNQFRTSTKRDGHKEKATDLSASIAFAPNNSEELALAYAARSDILRKIGQIDTGLLDLNRAIAALGKCNKTQMKLLQIRKQKYSRNKNKDQLSSNCNANDSCEVKNYNHFPGESPGNFLSPKLKVLENNTIVAILPIRPGEELMREELMVKAVEKDKRYTRCSHCLLTCNALIPCSSCTRLMFCSEKCLNEAYKSYHRSECQMVKFFDRGRKEVDIKEIIALRAFLIGTKQGKDLPKLLAPFKRLYGTQKEDVDSGKLTCVGDFLVALNNDESRITRLVEVLPCAVEMVIALRSFPFFSKKYSKPPTRLSEEEVLSTLLIAMNLISMGWGSKFNIMAQISSENLYGEEKVGYGIYIQQNLVRNSCYPNTIAIYRQGCRYLYSSRLIEKGEQVTYSQMCDLKYFTLDERKNNLAQEGLTCNCDACLENWQCKENFELQEIQFTGERAEELLIHHMKKVRDKYLKDFSPDDLYRMIIDCISILCICVVQPCPQILDFEEILTNFLKSSKSEFHFDCFSSIRETFFYRVNELLEFLDPLYELGVFFKTV